MSIFIESTMNKSLWIVLGFLLGFSGLVQADESSLPNGLVKFTKENAGKCVVFVIYKGELYCSSVPSNASVDPLLIQSEKQLIFFDDRAWKPSWGKNTEDTFTLEYVPYGQDVNQWVELITSQYMPKLKGRTAKELGEDFIKKLTGLGVEYDYQVYQSSPEQFIFEFRIKKPDNLQQDEIQKITVRQDGVYVLHYAVKTPSMTKEARKKWLNLIMKSSIK